MYLASAGASGGAGGAIAAVILTLVGLGFYFTPTIVAWVRHVPNAGSVTVINFLLGWTLVGWAVSLAMACRSHYQQQPHVQQVVNIGGLPPVPPPPPADQP